MGTYETIRSHSGVSEVFSLWDNIWGIVGTSPELFINHQWKAGRKYQIEQPEEYLLKGKRSFSRCSGCLRIRFKTWGPLPSIPRIGVQPCYKT